MARDSRVRGAKEVRTAFGLIIIGDEILSGKRRDQHLPKVIELLGGRVLRMSWAALENLRRRKTTEFPAGASLVARHHVVPGFPVMAWPMIARVLDTLHAADVHRELRAERSLLVHEQAEAVLTPLMEGLEARHPGVRVFSLPGVGDARTRRHIELGVKGEPEQVEAAWTDMCAALARMGAETGPLTGALQGVDSPAN
jgi:molybdopterin-biosynthesis enzyme MoeA-like protein